MVGQQRDQRLELKQFLGIERGARRLAHRRRSALSSRHRSDLHRLGLASII
jgi:hypothetical protein